MSHDDADSSTGGRAEPGNGQAFSLTGCGKSPDLRLVKNRVSTHINDFRAGMDIAAPSAFSLSHGGVA
ncbi:MAG: hypothetical protein AB7U81_12205 [Thiohalomonadaceae bacterium]